MPSSDIPDTSTRVSLLNGLAEFRESFFDLIPLFAMWESCGLITKACWNEDDDYTIDPDGIGCRCFELAKWI